jgi:Putative lumazine-binding
VTTVFADIGVVLRDYFDALYFCDVAKLQRVFHPKAIYATADEIPLLHRTMPEYMPVVAARQSPASRGESRKDHIDMIELAGENTAMARVRCSIGSRDFVDLLTLVRTDGRWQIMSKIFQIIENRD